MYVKSSFSFRFVHLFVPSELLGNRVKDGRIREGNDVKFTNLSDNLKVYEARLYCAGNNMAN